MERLVNGGSDNDLGKYSPIAVQSCLNIFLEDDTGPGESGFPSTRDLARAFRAAGHPCRWRWWDTGGPLYTVRLPNRTYSLFWGVDDPLVEVAAGESDEYGTAQIAVEARDFVKLLEYFDGRILPAVPGALESYVFCLEKELMAGRILRAARLAAGRP